MDNESTLKIDAVGTKRWYLDDDLHRVDGPACEYESGNKQWWLNGKVHRVDGPAIEWGDHTEWWLNDNRHRVDGPAVVFASGRKEWWLNSKYYYTFDKWLEANTYISEEGKVMLKLQYG
jgi:hypothetical protein